MNKKWRYMLWVMLFVILGGSTIVGKSVYAEPITGTRINPDSNQWESVQSELAVTTHELTGENVVLKQYVIGTQGWSAVQRARYEFYVDFTNADVFQYGNYRNESVKCCSNPNHYEKQYQTVTIRNKTYTYDQPMWYRESESYGYGPNEDISGENWGVEKVVIDLYNPRTTCRSCGSQVSRVSSLPGWIYVRDYRGSAKLSDLTVGWGDSVTISPEYNQYADHVSWAIRYYGETSFAPLSDGQKSDGMVISGANTKNLTITNFPATTSPITLGLYIYDKNNQLPVGSSLPNTKYTMSVRGYDLTGPVVNVSKVPDEANGCIVVKIEATDPGGLYAYPYSFDGGVIYGQASSKGFTQPGKVVVAVKDRSGNVTVKEVVIDAIDIERLKPSKPSESGNDINIPGTGHSAGGGASGVFLCPASGGGA